MGKRWIHYATNKKDCSGDWRPDSQGTTTECGKTAKRIMATKKMDRVTCPMCLEIMKRGNWYCSIHGFLPDAKVDNDETCEDCGNNVA